jgi:hypothetical protein
MLKEWLVEIRVKDWVHLPEGQGRMITYEEVLADNEYHARNIAFDSFSDRIKYDPIMRRKMEQRGLEIKDCCAPDAVALI